jgi:hypothetical protein
VLLRVRRSSLTFWYHSVHESLFTEQTLGICCWKDLIGLEGGWIGVSKNLKLKNSNAEVKYQPVLPVGLDRYYRLIPVLPMQTDRYYR